jgi:hypothetical protein
MIAPPWFQFSLALLVLALSIGLPLLALWYGSW